MADNMKYYKYLDEESPIGSGMRYVETDEDYAIREVTLNEDSCIASNILYPIWGMCLAEGQVEYDEFEEISSISKFEFDEAWNKKLTQNTAQWLNAKETYPIGKSIQGAIVVFYPQGVIVHLGNSVLGVADYKACRDSTEAKFMYPKHKITAVVKDYDELNQWLILDSPIVHKEEIEIF